MSSLRLLRLCAVRNVQLAELNLHSTLNIIHGKNGSGKTSILEAIHLLASGKSFRSSKTSPLISTDADQLTIYAETQKSQRISLKKQRSRASEMKLDLEIQKNWDSVARLLPIQVLDASSFLLLEGGPRSRRRFLDWGVFHVEHNFLNHWRTTRKCIANRNQLLKSSQLDKEQLAAWDKEFCLASGSVDLSRKHYFDRFLPVFQKTYQNLAADGGVESVTLEYNRGWDKNIPLEEVLLGCFKNDLRYGATQHGPHRADISFKVGKLPAIDVLSRGQQKLLVSALKIAQGRIFSEVISDECIYLVDDLPAELDGENREKVLQELLGLNSQLLVTCVELSSVERCLKISSEASTFHVERGRITG